MTKIKPYKTFYRENYMESASIVSNEEEFKFDTALHYIKQTILKYRVP